jgi:hypothetical protein
MTLAAWTVIERRQLMTTVAFVTKVFVRSGHAADAPKQAAFGRLGGGNLGNWQFALPLSGGAA